MIEKRNEAAAAAAMRVAQDMVAAALTAPKGCGVDNVDALIISGEEKDVLASHMRDIARETGEDFYERDAGNVDNSHCVVIIAAMDNPIQLTNCGYCGFPDCAANRQAGASCAFNVTDAGIAIGSAVSVAADRRMDNRVLFSAGKAALRMNLFPEGTRVCYGIPLSTSSKSVFFDRGTGDVSF